MSAEYVSDAAEISCRKLANNADNLNVGKIPEYGDNIETALMVNPCSRTSRGRGFSDTGSGPAVTLRGQK